MALLIFGLDQQIGDGRPGATSSRRSCPRSKSASGPRPATRRHRVPGLHASRLRQASRFPNLKAMFSRSAGVEAFIDHPRMPKVPLGKIEPAGGDPMMTEYVVMHVLRLHREMPAYQAAQANREWLRAPIMRPRAAPHRLPRLRHDGEGAGAGAEVARLPGLGLGALPRPDAEVPIFHGPDQLEPFLRQTDIAVCLLPLTRETEGILCARTFAMMPKGAMVINIGRGRHVVDQT